MRFLLDIEVTDYESDFIDRDGLEYILRAALVDGLRKRDIGHLFRVIPEDLTNGTAGFFETINLVMGVLK